MAGRSTEDRMGCVNDCRFDGKTYLIRRPSRNAARLSQVTLEVAEKIARLIRCTRTAIPRMAPIVRRPARP